jgi:hypothetical protein
MANDNTKKRIGTMPCEGSRCKSHEKAIPVVVFENSKGTLSYRCDYCDRAPYARAGTDQHDDWMQDIKLFSIAKTEAAAVVVPPLVKSGGFDMGAL